MARLCPTKCHEIISPIPDSTEKAARAAATHFARQTPNAPVGRRAPTCRPPQSANLFFDDRRSQCLRPAPTKLKHTLGTPPPTQASPTCDFWAVLQAESARNATQRRRSPGRRSRQRTAPAENHTEVQDHGGIGVHFLRKRPEAAGHDRGQSRGNRQRQRGRNPQHRDERISVPCSKTLRTTTTPAATLPPLAPRYSPCLVFSCRNIVA